VAKLLRGEAASPNIGNTVARLNGVHAFGYMSAGSESISVKFGVLRVHCPELALADFGRDLRRSESGRASRNFVFCLVSNGQPVSQIVAKLFVRNNSRDL